MKLRHSLAATLAALLLASGPASAEQISIAVENGRLTGHIRDYPFDAALKELASRTGVALIPADDMNLGTARVSAELTGVPIDEALRGLLRNYDTFFFYGAAGNGPSSLRAVWIYRQGTAANLRPVPPETWASNKDLHGALSDPDPVVRARAYEALMSRPDRDGRELVMLALRGNSEPDDRVRERLLAIAVSTDMPLPPDLLMNLARWDRSAGVRLNALNALASQPTWKEAAEAALNDSNPRIRRRAKEILAELAARSQ